MKYKIAYLPALQRDLVIARALRRKEDKATKIETQCVDWDDMTVSFETDTPISAASVEVSSAISIATFTPRLESMLDCGDSTYKPRSESDAWTLKFSTAISKYKESADDVVRLLCDRISTVDAAETIGVMKIKRRGVKVGHAKIRIVPSEDLLQVACRHQTAAGLKAVWKSVFWRLNPQYGAPKPIDGNAPVVKKKLVLPDYVIVDQEPCIWCDLKYASDWPYAVARTLKYGGEVDMMMLKQPTDSRPKGFSAPIAGNNFKSLGDWSCSTFYGSPDSVYYSFSLKVKKVPAGCGAIPGFIATFDSAQGVPPKITIRHGSYALFHKRLKSLFSWLKLDFSKLNLPEPSDPKDIVPTNML